MISEKQKQIIRLLLTSKEGYNVNQIARILNISVSWAHETLKLLEKEGILLSVKIANSILYRLNWESQKAQKITELILLDEKQSVKTPEKTEIQQNKYQNFQSFYTKAINQRGYTTPSQSNTVSASSYKQTISQTQSVGYNAVNPMGEKGVNNVLSSYGTSGAFGSSTGYSSSAPYSSTKVPPETLGSKISSNVSSFNLSQHTSSHKSITQGCRYCGP